MKPTPQAPSTKRLVLNIDAQLYDQLYVIAARRKAADDAARFVRAATYDRPLSRVLWFSGPGRQLCEENLAELQAGRRSAQQAQQVVKDAYRAYCATFKRRVGRPPLDGPSPKRLYVYVQELINERLLSAAQETADA